MNIQECLKNLSDNPILIISATGNLTRDRVLCHKTETRRALSGIRIGIQIADPGIAFTMLAILDGTAEIIMLVSPSVGPELVTRLALQCNLDAILCDSPSVFTAVKGSLPAFKNIETLAVQFLPRDTPVETRWVLTTSGTTGEPKLVSHTFASLTRTTKMDLARGASVRWGLLYDYTRFAGLQVLLQSILSGSTLIAPALNEPLGNKITSFIINNCTHLSGTPTIWRKLIMTPGSEKLNLQQVTLGGEIADDRILYTIAMAYPQARVIHIFASTEAGVGFSVVDKRAGFPASYLTEPPTTCVGIKVDNGRLYLRNNQVIPHYLGLETSFANDDGWVDTGDTVDIKGDRVLFKGRANGVINIGGDKVHPEEIEQVLLSHSLVSAARVYARSNPITGALVAADIVLADSNANPVDARETLRAYVQQELGRTKTPATIKFVLELDLSTAGKLARS